jgi:hypothetical protein
MANLEQFGFTRSLKRRHSNPSDPNLRKSKRKLQSTPPDGKAQQDLDLPPAHVIVHAFTLPPSLPKMLPDIWLSSQQQNIVAIAKTRKSIFFTGPAGAHVL